MENKMIINFLIALFLTFIIVRIGAHTLHDFKAYDKKGWKGKDKDKSKTITGYLRRLTGLDMHHIHLGALLLFIFLIIFLILGLTKTNLILLGISLSLIADQIFPLLKLGNYFSKKMLVISILLHILIAISAILLLE